MAVSLRGSRGIGNVLRGGRGFSDELRGQAARPPAASIGTTPFRALPGAESLRIGLDSLAPLKPVLKPALGAGAAQLILNSGLPAATQQTLLSALPAGSVSTAAPAVSGTGATAAGLKGIGAAGTGVGAGSNVAVPFTSAGAGALIGTIGAGVSGVLAAEQTARENQTRITDATDNLDDLVDNTFRQIYRTPSVAQRFAVDPRETARGVSLNSDDPNFLVKIDDYFEDINSRFEEIGRKRNWINVLGGLPESTAEVDGEMNSKEQVLQDRRRLLGWQRQGVMALAEVVPQGQTQSLQDWVEELSHLWQQTSSPDDFIRVEEIKRRGGSFQNNLTERIVGRNFFDKATGELLHSQFGFDQQEEIRRQRGSSFQNSRAENPERFNVWSFPWLADFSNSRTQWTVNDRWQTLPSDYIFIGLPGTGQPLKGWANILRG